MRSSSNRPIIRDQIWKAYDEVVLTRDTIIEQMKIYSLRKMVEPYNTISSKAMLLCTPYISECADYPDIITKTLIQRRVGGMISSSNSLGCGVPWEERYQVAVLATYKSLYNYVSIGKSVTFLEYVDKSMPIIYTRDLARIDNYNTGIIQCKDADISSKDKHLPESGQDYADIYLKDNISTYCKDYFQLIGRSNLYKLPVMRK